VFISVSNGTKNCKNRPRNARVVVENIVASFFRKSCTIGWLTPGNLSLPSQASTVLHENSQRFDEIELLVVITSKSPAHSPQLP